MTPPELAALVGVVANSGTLHYLQLLRWLEEIDRFVPRITRRLDIARWLPNIKPGMMGAVEYGTARRACYNPDVPTSVRPDPAPIADPQHTCGGSVLLASWATTSQW